jgi:hypothetical protein
LNYQDHCKWQLFSLGLAQDVARPKNFVDEQLCNLLRKKPWLNLQVIGSAPTMSTQRSQHHWHCQRLIRTFVSESCVEAMDPQADPAWILALFQQCRLQNLETICLHLDDRESTDQMTAWPLLGTSHDVVDLTRGDGFVAGQFHNARCSPKELVYERLRQAGVIPWGAQPPASSLLSRLTALLLSAGGRLVSVRALDLRLNGGRGAGQRVDCAALAATAAACQGLESLTAAFSIDAETVPEILRMRVISRLWHRVIEKGAEADPAFRVDPAALRRLASGLPRLAELGMHFPQAGLERGFRIDSDSLRVLRVRHLRLGKVGSPVQLACPALREIDVSGVRALFARAAGGGSQGDCLMSMPCLQKLHLGAKKSKKNAKQIQTPKTKPRPLKLTLQPYTLNPKTKVSF